MEEPIVCPICRKYGITKDVKMLADGEGHTKNLGQVRWFKCPICKTRLPKRTGRVKTLQGVGKP